MSESPDKMDVDALPAVVVQEATELEAPVLDDMFGDEVPPPAKEETPAAASVSGGDVSDRAPSSVPPGGSPLPLPTGRSNGSRSTTAPSSTSGRSGRDRSRNPLEYDEEDDMNAREDAEGVDIVTAPLELPDIPRMESSDGQHWVVTLPSHISIPSEPFHPDVYRSMYEGDQQKEDDAVATDEKDKRALAMRRMNEVENAVRWRWGSGSGGAQERKSNARIVRWSDGSSSIQIGKEFWDLEAVTSIGGALPFGTQQVNPELAAASASSSSSKPQPPSVKLEYPAPPQSLGVSLLLAADPENTVTISHALVTGTLGIQPSNKASRDKQRAITQASQHQSVKKSKIKTYWDASGLDPEAQREKREKERQKAAKGQGGRVLPSWRPSVALSKGGKKSGGAGRATRGDSMSDDEDDEDGVGEYEDEEDGGRVGFGRAPANASGYQDDGFVVSEGSDGGAEYGGGKSKKSKKNGGSSSTKQQKKKRTKDYSDSEEEAEFDEADAEGESEEEVIAEGEDDPMDELERADRAAEAAEKELRKSRKEAKGKKKVEKSAPVVDESMDIDIDSDDLDAMPAPAAKRVLQYDSDDE